mgnify:CR=1 FL=1
MKSAITPKLRGGSSFLGVTFGVCAVLCGGMNADAQVTAKAEVRPPTHVAEYSCLATSRRSYSDERRYDFSGRINLQATTDFPGSTTPVLCLNRECFVSTGLLNNGDVSVTAVAKLIPRADGQYVVDHLTVGVGTLPYSTADGAQAASGGIEMGSQVTLPQSGGTVRVSSIAAQPSGRSAVAACRFTFSKLD